MLLLVVMVASLRIMGMLGRVCGNMRYYEMVYLDINDMTNVKNLR